MAASDRDLLHPAPMATADASISSPRLLKLCCSNRAKLVSVPPDDFTFPNLLCLAAEAFPETQSHGSNFFTSQHTSTPHIEFSFSGENGETAIIDSEESFSAATPFLKLHGAIRLQIHPKGNGAGTSNKLSRSLYANSNASNRALISFDCRQPRIPCRYFQVGHCRNGSSCKFLHETVECSKLTNASKSITSASDIRTWLAKLNNASDHENIAYLSSAEGYEAFLHVLNRPFSPDADVRQIVSLLTRPNFRTSMLKQATDKIYTALVGSRFINRMHSHIRTSVQPRSDDIKPYIFLSEELMSRANDGWKEAPLDDLKTLLNNVRSDSALDLNSILSRLLDHRAKIKRLEAVSNKLENLTLVSTSFRDMTIIPLKEQILSLEDSHQLPVNQVGLRYPDIVMYLDTHFKLLQEDSIATLRNGVRKLQRNSRGDSSIHVYKNVRFAGFQCGPDGIAFRVSFSADTDLPIDWQSSKQLMSGSLLCMSCDKFETLLWALVANRSVEQLSDNMVDIQLLEHYERKPLRAKAIYVMAESSAASFKTYMHVLRTLQKPEMELVPFQEHFLALEPQGKGPTYLNERDKEDVYDFECAFPEMKDNMQTMEFHIKQNWPEWQNSLDDSQMRALKHGLTKRLSIIQGPPGTGKTFVGLLIVRIMLANLKRATSYAYMKLPELQQTHQEEDTIGGPVLVVCNTNHALDQFLEGIYAHERSIVRIGGRSKSSILQDCNLRSLVDEKRQDLCFLVQDDDIYTHKKYLEEKILECSDLMNVRIVTKGLLNAIATKQQLQSLFYEDCNNETVVDLWLYGRGKKVRGADDVEGFQREQSSMQNHFEVLQSGKIDDAFGESLGVVKMSSNLGFGQPTKCPNALHARPLTENVEITGKNKAECKPVDSVWTAVNAREVRRNMPLGENSKEMTLKTNHKFVLEKHFEQLEKHSNVWSLESEDRWALHSHWLKTIRRKARKEINRLSSQFEKTCQILQEHENEVQLSLLRKAKIVGITTTVAACYRSVLESLQAEIVVVEEAAQVLESHIVACLTASTKHLVLIGDHFQLRPKVAVHELAVKHRLDVSLFERLLKSGVEYVNLEVQRRMRPSISMLISDIYPMLKDHESVEGRENIKGVRSNVFFLHHTAPEEHQGDDETGKVNIVEAQLVVELCAYLVKQQYSYSDVTVLSMYKGQTQEIIRQLAQKLAENHGGSDEDRQNLPCVSSVDDYQGENCKIIILSLVRNNCLPTAGTPVKSGFLAESNRTCAALSRAQDGLFIFGNGELLSQESDMWKSVMKKLQQSDSYGEELVLVCQNHPDREVKVKKPGDFQSAPDGGCDRACGHQLRCGHACPKHCHPGPHDKIVCPKHCARNLPHCDHQCRSLCHYFENCPPCLEPVLKTVPQCGHSVNAVCSTSTSSVRCSVPCPKILNCSHKCQNKCGEGCTLLCKELVERELPCGHLAKISCHINPLTYQCQHPCQTVLPTCQHICSGSCGACKEDQTHLLCKQNCNGSWICSHPCQHLCHQGRWCPPCNRPCEKKCSHGHCPNKCREPCVPCKEPCSRACRHYACKLLCHELCSQPCCNEPCEKLLECRHRCLGFCGEPCPKTCRICTSDFEDTISTLKKGEFAESDRLVELQDCGHVFEASGLDTWMCSEQSEPGTNCVSPKQCPQCRTPVTTSVRYGNQLKSRHNRIEAAKWQFIDFLITYAGIKLLQDYQYETAVEKFVAALKRNASNFEARLGLGNAFCLQRQFGKGIQFFQSVVGNSPLSSALDEIETPSSDRSTFSWTKLSQIPPDCPAAIRQQATRALVQWAAALSNMGKFTDAGRLCEIVLREEPDNEEAKKVLQLVNAGQNCGEEVVMQEIERTGNWEQCRNFHYYVAGHMGDPTHALKCPHC